MNSLEKALWLINRLSDMDAPVSLSTLSKELDMSRSGVFKILSTLVENNFVLQDPRTKHYRLGASLLRLGFEVGHQLGIWDIAELTLRELVNMCAPSVSIGILEGERAFLAYMLVNEKYSYYNVKQGSSYPLYASAIGKCLAAYMDDDILHGLLSRAPLEKFTDNTITDVETLLEEYRTIRKNGYSMSYEEHRPTGAAIAAPIKIRNTVNLCLSIGGFLPDFDRQKMKHFIPILQGAARCIEEKMEYKH